MRTFKRSYELTPYLTRVLDAKRVQYSLGTAENGDYAITVPLNGTQFRELVLEAKAAKKTDEIGILHVTRGQMCNGELMEILNRRKTDGKNPGFIVI